MLTLYDELCNPCPMLGHLVNFAYCRSTSGNTPCRKIADCWFQRFPVEDYLQRCFPDQLNLNVSAVQKGKLTTILEIVKRLQNE